MIVNQFTPPDFAELERMITGDMPGDVVQIKPSHIAKARVIIPHLLALLQPILAGRPESKAVVAVHGGSGVGKSETGSVLSWYLKNQGIGSYVLSGDNYPRRIPSQNDQERFRVFREAALKGLVNAGEYSPDRNLQLWRLQVENRDYDPSAVDEFPWLTVYQTAGRQGLKEYLGTSCEIDFAELSKIIKKFKQGKSLIWLKRMGRHEKELWYDAVDFSEISVLLIEWTHGNNPELAGVDIPILLNSTQQETLEHRKARNRDGAVDSPFTSMVLAIEQEKIINQADRARLIVTKSGELVSYGQFLELMRQG